MSFNESIVEDASLTWFGELVLQAREVGRGPHLTPGEPAAERESRWCCWGVCEAIRRLAPAISQSVTLATLRDMVLPKLLSGEIATGIPESTQSL